MDAVLKDPADPSDQTLIAIHEWWPLGGETHAKLGLHIHGDDFAKGKGAEVTAAIGKLRRSANPLTRSELDAAVRDAVASLGLEATLTDTRCVADHLGVAMDISVWRKRPADD